MCEDAAFVPHIAHKDAGSVYDIPHEDAGSLYGIGHEDADEDAASMHVKGRRVLVRHGVTCTAPRRRTRRPCTTKDAGSSYDTAYEYAASSHAMLYEDAASSHAVSHKDVGSRTP